MPSYRTMTGPKAHLSALLELAVLGAASLTRRMSDEERGGLERLSCAVTGDKMPGHPPGKTRGPELNLIRRRVSGP